MKDLKLHDKQAVLEYLYSPEFISKITQSNGRIMHRKLDKNAWLRKDIMREYELIHSYFADVSFETALSMLVNNIKVVGKCEICGGVCNLSKDALAFRNTCSTKCGNLIVAKLRETTMLERYGVRNPSELSNHGDKIRESYANTSVDVRLHRKLKTKQTKLERYGDENYNNAAKQLATISAFTDVKKESIARQTKQTKLERYGDENYNNAALIKETCIERYGVDNVRKTDAVKNKIHVTKQKKYGDKYQKIVDKCVDTNRVIYGKDWFLSLPVRTKTLLTEHNLKKLILKHGSAREIATKLFITQKTVYDYIHSHDLWQFYDKHKAVFASGMELEIRDFLNIDFEYSNRSVIKPLELDIYIPEHKLAIEMDGVYWHSNKHKHKDYHLNKTILCEDKDIQLLHIFENEWNDDIKRVIWKSLINNKLGLSRRIFARKCDLKEICSKERNQFLALNHLQGADKANHSFGLYEGEVLVAVMSFIKSRFNKAFKWELSRFCCLNGVSIVGGASRLLTAFRRRFKGDIISYANRRWSEGGLYRALGFEELEPTKPNYFYFKTRDIKLYSRQKFQKHKLEKQLDDFDSNMTEWQNMEANGWLKIYDSGNRVFVLT